MNELRQECKDFMAKCLTRGLTRQQADNLWAEYKIAHGIEPGAMTGGTGRIFAKDTKEVDAFLDARAPQKRAKFSRIFPKGKIDDEELKEFVYFLDYERDGHTSDKEIARRFCDEHDLPKNRAESLLAMVRKLRSEGRVRI